MNKLIVLALVTVATHVQSRTLGTDCNDDFQCMWAQNSGLYIASACALVAIGSLAIYGLPRFIDNLSSLILKLVAKKPNTLVELDLLINTRGDTGGLNKRIDENREIMELIFSKAPELISSHPWLVGWLNANDAFFTQLAEIYPHKDKTHIRALPTMNTAGLAHTLSNEII